jgi:hypothetical protein
VQLWRLVMLLLVAHATFPCSCSAVACVDRVTRPQLAQADWQPAVFLR